MAISDNTVQGTSAPKRKTTFTKFFSSNPNHDAMFAVNADISAIHALEMASTSLVTADGIMNAVAVEADNASVWAAAYLVEMSKAIVTSAIGAGEREEH